MSGPSPIDWGRIEQEFHNALDLSEPERAAFVEAQPPEIREPLHRLLAGAKYEGQIERAIQGAATLVNQPPGMLGPYRLVRLIGSGGMGSVYLAVRADDQYQKQVAIKLMRRGMDTQEMLNRFRQERQILANLEHPHIARLLDGGAAPDGRPYLVMEYLQGRPLDVYCREAELDLADRCRLFLKVCGAVSFAHRNLVVHRDLKPANILVDDDGAPKLLDFGMAKLLDAGGDGGVTRTVPANRPVTPDYVSPEQYRGTSITTAADVYSLGAVLFALLTNHAPHRFSSYSASELERVICQEEPPRASELATRWKDRIRGDLDAIVAKAMRKEPALRYASVDQLAEDVGRYLGGLPVAARRGNLQYRASKFLKRHAAAIGVGTALATALIGGSTIALLQAQRAGRERQNAVASQRRADASRVEAERQAQEALRQSALAEEQRKRAELEAVAAETQRQIASRRFDQVRELAGKFILDFDRAIQNLPGSTAARKMMVETGLKYFDTLVQEAHGDRGLLEEIARGYDRLGDVQGNGYYSNLGDIPGALATYHKAESIRAKISDPAIEFLRDRVAGDMRLGEMAHQRGDLRQAERYFADGLKLAQGDSSSDYDLRRLTANFYFRFGDIDMTQGVFGKAAEHYTQSLDAWLELQKVGRNPLTEKAGVSAAHNKLAEALLRTDRPKEALEHAHAALAIDEALLREAPVNTGRRRLVRLDYAVIARVFNEDAAADLDQAEALVAFESAARMSDQMAAADPNDRRAQEDVRASQSAWGDYLKNHRDIPGALLHYRRALAAAEAVAALTPSTIGAPEFLLQAHERLAMALIGDQKASEALEHLQKAEGYRAAAEKQSPGLIRWVGWSSDILRSQGRAYAVLHNWPEAIHAYRETLAAYEELKRRDPTNETFDNDMRYPYAELADCHAALSQWEPAIQAMQLALEKIQKVESRRPLNSLEAAAQKEAREKLALWKRKSNPEN
jgi:tetratricopeptide (TPR) repeat protein